MEKPIISFIIPMYNAGNYIVSCIESIQSQDLRHGEYEIVIIDDGSNDDGEEKCANFEAVIYFRQMNQGQSAARNKGLEIAKGEYVMFVDADDALIPNSISEVLEAAAQEDLDMCSFSLREINYGESLITNDSVRQRTTKSRILTGIEYLEEYNYNNGPWWYIVKRNILIENDIRFVPGHYGEDGMFTMKLLLTVARIAHIDKACYLYIRRPSSITTSVNVAHQKKMIEDYLFVYHYMQDLITENKENLSKSALERCNARSESYLFFLLIRLLKFPIESDVKHFIQLMKQEKLFPVKKPYKGITYSALEIILNRSWLLLFFNRLYNMWIKLIS